MDGSKSNLKIINIEVQEKPTGEISAGAGIGSSGGTFAIMVSENNWLGQGKKVGFELEVDEDINIYEFDKNSNYFVFSGIGNHQTFISMLKNYGLKIIKDLELTC